MNKINFYDSILLMLSTCLVLNFSGCSGYTDKEDAKNTLSVKMNWQHRYTENSLNYRYAERNICADYGITHISVMVTNVEGNVVGQPSWPCDHHGGKIENVPTGAGYRVAVSAFVGNKIDWQAETKDVMVQEGNTTVNALMEYIGDDNVPPSVRETWPKHLDTDIPITSTIEILMDDSLMHSSIDGSSIYLQRGLDKIPGIISHEPMSDKIEFKPHESLAYDTEYTATLTCDISDSSNNVMTGDYQFSFRTQAFAPNKVPERPAGVKVFPGNQQVYLSWDDVPYAESYSVYQGFSPTVSPKTNAHEDVRDTGKEVALNWEQLINGKVNYFVIVARNKNGESLPSKTVSATPQLLPIISDLVTYYDFRNGMAKDISNNANHGTVYNAVPAADKLGKPSHALEFNGVDSYVKADNPSNFELIEYTIVGVIKTKNTSQKSRVLTRGYPSHNYAIAINREKYNLKGNISYSHNTGTAGVPSFDSLISKDALPADLFYHFAVVVGKMLNSSDYFFNSYVNGVLVNSVSDISEPLKLSGEPLFIGGILHNNQFLQMFEGVIDDLVIYKKPLKHVDIKEIYEFMMPPVDAISLIEEDNISRDLNIFNSPEVE